MKKIIVTGFTAQNIANQESVSFTTNGGNVIVTGENGAGKTTLKNALMWALIGSTADGEKLIPYNSDKLPIVEVEITDGTVYTKFRKELFQRQSFDGKISRTVNCFINGTPATLKDINEYFSRLIPNNSLEIILNLGSFFKQKSEVQRKILTEHISDVKDEDVIASDASLSELDVNGFSVEGHGERMKLMLRKIKSERASIKPKIDVLSSQIVDVEDEREELQAEIATLESKLAEYDAELLKIQDMQSRSELNRRIISLESEVKILRSVILHNKNKLEKLRERYAQVGGKCPTCGQAVNVERAERIREGIADKGKALKIETEDHVARLSENEKELEELKLRAGKVRSDVTEITKTQRDNLRKEIAARQSRIENITFQLESNVKKRRQIEELIVKEKTYGLRFLEYERQLSLVEKFVQKKMEMITDAINSRFQYVKFKMFETLKSGEVRNICEATLNGVPYSQLSKGEKLKAALDILQTFQSHYGVMLPLIIDDAESYTSNSLIEIPNQKILFKVVEGQELKIEVQPMERRLSA